MFQAMDAQSLIVLYFDILIVKEVAGGRMYGRKEEDWEEEQRRRSAPAQCWLWRWQVWWVGNHSHLIFTRYLFYGIQDLVFTYHKGKLECRIFKSLL